MKLLLYCTKAKPRLMISCKGEYKLEQDFEIITDKAIVFNGKIIAECDYEVEHIWCELFLRETPYGMKPEYKYYTETSDDITKESCLTYEQMDNYLEKKDINYAIHIKNLHIFDEPKELSDYYETKDMHSNEDHNWYNFGYHYIDTAPKNMRLVSDKDNGNGNNFIMISIKPDELCRVLNGEQTIIVRKKVLKEMIK